MPLSLGLLCASLILWWATLSSCANAEAEFDYSDGPLGPANWGDLRPEWRLCSIGMEQSPVAINEADICHEQNVHRLTLNYKNSSSARLQLSDHDVKLEWLQDRDSVYWDGEEYKVINLHWHTPAEHSINGVSFALEAHIVHEGYDHGKLLVIGLQYTYGDEDNFLTEVIKEFPSLVDTEKVDCEEGNVSLDSIEFGEHYYHYKGSLTTPPCDEGVTWIIMKKKHSVSEEQVNAVINFEQGENARPEQPLNGRNIYKYDLESMENLQSSFYK